MTLPFTGLNIKFFIVHACAKVRIQQGRSQVLFLNMKLIFLLLLGFMPLLLVSSQELVLGDPDEVFQAVLMEAFKKALVNNSQNLHALQDIFFNADGSSPARVNISVTTAVDSTVRSDGPWDQCVYGDLPMASGAYYAFSLTFTTYCYDNLCNYNPCWRRPLCNADTIIWTDLPNRLGALSELLLNDQVWGVLSSIDLVTSQLLLLVPIPLLADVPMTAVSMVIPELKNGLPCEQDYVYALKAVFVWVS